ncbi:MAG: hypothetical protein LBR38_02245 [Synergistaceae bacterium]|jgi:hypothetical protein|nr:hypothetical protein [Synergistaceae bacterium]
MSDVQFKAFLIVLARSLRGCQSVEAAYDMVMQLAIGDGASDLARKDGGGRGGCLGRG